MSRLGGLGFVDSGVATPEISHFSSTCQMSESRRSGKPPIKNFKVGSTKRIGVVVLAYIHINFLRIKTALFEGAESNGDFIIRSKALSFITYSYNRPSER